MTTGSKTSEYSHTQKAPLLLAGLRSRHCIPGVGLVRPGRTADSLAPNRCGEASSLPKCSISVLTR
jgi:hypothetical protein